MDTIGIMLTFSGFYLHDQVDKQNARASMYPDRTPRQTNPPSDLAPSMREARTAGCSATSRPQDASGLEFHDDPARPVRALPM